MSGQSWTPAPKKGIIPLHPLTFGMILGKAFSALRHNPKVLFGFAVVLQLVVALVTSAIMAAVLITTFLRLETVSPASEDFLPIMWGSIAINGLVAIGIAFASVAFTAIMQGVVAADIGYAAVGEKPTLGRLWRRMRPAFWRLVAFSVLQILFMIGALAIGAGIIAAILGGGVDASSTQIAVVVVVIILFVLALIPLWIWLYTKLLLVPSILVLEGAGLRTALVRSWRLTRRRFWVAFGVMFLISAIMGLAMNVVSLPLALLSSMFTGIIAPTGPNDTAGIVAMVLTAVAPQLLLLVIQAVSIVVQCTGAALIYVDSRMRYEGLDQTLIVHVERRDLGWTEEQLGDPFAVDPARAVTSDPPPPPQAPYPPQPHYPAPPAGWAQPPQQDGGQPYGGQDFGGQGYGGQHFPGPSTGSGSEDAQTWAPPGQSGSGST